MALDAGIYGQIQQPATYNPLSDMAQFQQVQALQNQNKLASLGFAQKEQDQQDQTTLRNALLGLGAGATDDQRISALKNTGLPSGFTQADALQTSVLNRQKTEAQSNKDNASADKDRLAEAITKQQQIAQAAGAATDQASWERGLIIAHSLGADISKVPPQFDPAVAKQLAMQSLSGQQQLEQVWKQKGYELDVTKQAETVRHDRSTESLTARGQNMTDSRMRDANAVTQQAAANATSMGRLPVGYRWKPDGTQEPIPGGPADPANTAAAVKLKDVPATVNQKVIEGQQSVSNIDAAIDAVKKNPDAFGLVNAVPGALAVRDRIGGQGAVDARAQVANIGSLKLHDRSGAAVSASEFPRLAPFIPSASDPPAAVITKLTQMKQIAESELGLYADTYNEDAGYRPTQNLKKLADKNRISTPAAAPASAHPADIDALLNKYK